MNCPILVGPNQDQREPKKWRAPDSRPALEDPQAHIEFTGFDPLQDRSEMCIEQADMQIGPLTPELPDGLRQDVGRDHGRRSDRQHLSGSFRSPSNPRHRSIECLQMRLRRREQFISVSRGHDVASGAIKQAEFRAEFRALVSARSIPR